MRRLDSIAGLQILKATTLTKRGYNRGGEVSTTRAIYPPCLPSCCPLANSVPSSTYVHDRPCVCARLYHDHLQEHISWPLERYMGI